MPKISTKTVISDKYQVVIPKSVRERLKLKIGQTVFMHPLPDQNGILLTAKSKSAQPWYDQLAGLDKEVWQGIDPVEYIRSLRSEWDR